MQTLTREFYRPLHITANSHPLTMREHFYYQQYATLLRELRTLPDPCDTMHKNKYTNGANPRPSQMLNTPLEGS